MGARPIFADVEAETGNVSERTIREAFTVATRAVIVVDQGGMPVDLEPIRNLRDPLGVTVIEDSSCGVGSTYRGRPPGSGLVTGIVDHTRDAHGVVHARLLDLVPGRSGKTYADWLKDCGTDFTAGIKTAALDPFRGYANAIRDELPEAITVLDAFRVVKLGSAMVDEVRRRVQQRTRSDTGDARAIHSFVSAGRCRSAPNTSPTNRPPGSMRNSSPGTPAT